MKTKNTTNDTAKTTKTTKKKTLNPAKRKPRNFDWYSEYREYDKPLSKLWKIYCYDCKRQYYTVKAYLKHMNEPIHRDSKTGVLSCD